jgi:predicted nucleotidyltransferase
MYSQDVIDKIKELILDNLENVDNIILFGSYARGTANEKSDLDFIVLVNSKLERKEKLQLLAKIRWAIAVLGYNADILIKEKSIYLKEITLPTIARTVHNEGKSIWTRT